MSSFENTGTKISIIHQTMPLDVLKKMEKGGIFVYWGSEKRPDCGLFAKFALRLTDEAACQRVGKGKWR